ncbi:glycosyltransferase family 34 protein [Sporormia fimetaria CBS 119925]|uniref:Glycosyltransferase family 34 protein n=1 Tax=Sporormia fimetaria CBS 119925 TaxID=1340428 RepID=A0A6A6V2W5_9PLEO|nr:glycosyltransferase family 34 protein [Sporormia fimetaria CBS 119925]
MRGSRLPTCATLLHASLSKSGLLTDGPPLGPQLTTYGTDRCLPRKDDTLSALALSLRQSCDTSSPHTPSNTRIGVVTAQFGDPEPHYAKALQTHHLHSMIHSTELHVMCSPMIDDLWNKPAFILALLLDEMLKPESKRLEWIFWVDRDTIILDQCRPISSFLPPVPKDDPGMKTEIKTHMIVTKDFNGLNNGIFAMRVGHWSINLLMDILAFRDYKPDVQLIFTEQSAMELVMKEAKFAPHVQYVPQEWFNAYPHGSAEEYETREDEEGLERFHVRRGDFLVHFAGVGERGREMLEWVRVARRVGNVWEGGRVLRDLKREIEGFWERLKVERGRVAD